MRIVMGCFLLLCAGVAGLAAPGPDATPLRIVLLPVIDALPVHVAARAGAFEAAGLRVERIAAASAAERDQILQAGKADAAITDLVALALYNRGGLPVVGVRYSMRPTPGAPQFRLLAPGGSNAAVRATADLRGRQVAISSGTVSEYVTRRLLEAAGLAGDAVALEGVPAIPARMALLRSGRVGAATLPEPLATLAEQHGAVALADDGRTPVPGSCAVFAVTRRFAEAHGAAVRAFVRVVSETSASLNAAPQRAAAVLGEERLLPPELAGSYRLPPFPADEVPDETAWADVCRWLKSSGRVESPAAWDVVLTRAYLPPHD